MSESKKIIIFDFDGVIINTFKFCHRIISKIEKDVVTPEQYKSRFDGNIFGHLKKIKNDAHFIPKENDPFFSRYEPQLMKGSLQMGISEIVKQLSQEYILVINSSTMGSIIEKFLESNHLRSYFRDVNGPEVSMSKVEKFNKVLKKYKVASNDCLFVTDTLGDLREAAEVAIPSIAVTWGYHERERLEQGISEAIVDTPDELLQEITKHFNN